MNFSYKQTEVNLIFGNIFQSNTTVKVRAVKHGNLVTLCFPTVNVPAASGPIYFTASQLQLPPDLRPDFEHNQLITVISGNKVRQVPGLCRVQADGTVYIFNEVTATENFETTQSNGWRSFSVTYFTANAV